ALASDMTFVSREKAVLSQWEVGIGLVAGGGPMARLPRLIGRGRALEVLLSSEDIGGELAEAYGYVNRALPDAELDGFVDAPAKPIAVRVEVAASRVRPVAVSIIDTHGNMILQHRMSGAPAFSLEISERKAYTSALVGMRTADLLPLVQPGQDLFPLMGLAGGRYCAMGGGAPLSRGGERVAGVGVSGGTVEQDVAILDAGLQDA